MHKYSTTAAREAVEQLTPAQLVTRAEEWRTVRAIRAAQGYHLYSLGASDASRAVVVSPPKLDRKSGEFISEHYTLLLEEGRCSCGDQEHLDRLHRAARRAGVEAQIGRLECKHATIWALLTARRAEIEDAERRERAERAAAVAARERYERPRAVPAFNFNSPEWERQVRADFD